MSFILDERNIGSLETQVEAGYPRFDYLSVSQFAARYGQPASNVSALTSYLASYGITTDVYPDNVDVVANGTAGEFDKALAITEKQATVPAQKGTSAFGHIRAQNVYTNTQAPLLPYRLASFVTAILGLSNYSDYVSQIAKPASQDKPQSGNSSTCVAEFGLTNGCHLPQDFAKMYNLDPLYSTANGSGQTVGIVTLAAVDQGAPEYFWSNIAKVNRTGSLTVDNVDGGPGAPSGASGSDETDLDIEQSGALAPGANVIDYQAPNTDYGFADAFFTAASQNLASDVSASWGESETILQAASCPARSPRATRRRSTRPSWRWRRRASPGSPPPPITAPTRPSRTSAPRTCRSTTRRTARSSPRAAAPRCPGPPTCPARPARLRPRRRPRASGAGTTCGRRSRSPTAYPRPRSRRACPSAAAAASACSIPTPSYQRDVSGTNNFHAVEYLTPTDYTQVAPGLTEPQEWTFNPTPSVTSGFGTGRALPDLATDADPQTGYLVYGPSVGGLNEYGGTSFVAPQLNGATAVIDSYLGHRVGFWNPVIYLAAASGSMAYSPSSTRPAPAMTTSTTPATPARSTTRASASASRTWPSWPTSSVRRCPSDPFTTARYLPSPNSGESRAASLAARDPSFVRAPGAGQLVLPARARPGRTRLRYYPLTASRAPGVTVAPPPDLSSGRRAA